MYNSQYMLSLLTLYAFRLKTDIAFEAVLNDPVQNLGQNKWVSPLAE